MTKIAQISNSSTIRPALGATIKPARTPSTRQPNAPVDVRGSLAQPRPLSDEGSVSSARLGAALDRLASAKAFGPQFTYTRMTEAEAVAATTTALAAVQKLAHEGTASLHGFVPRLTFKDELGRINVRLTRVYAGVPIFGSEVVAHFDNAGTCADITGSPLPADLKVATKPALDSAAAVAICENVFAVKPDRRGGPELVIAKTDDGVFHLAYHVTLANYTDGEPRCVNYFVDATNGDVLPLTFIEHRGVVPEHVARCRTRRGARLDEAPSTPAPTGEGTPAEGTGDSIFSGKVKLTTTKVGDTYVLRDPKAHGSETRDAHNAGGGPGSSNTVFTDNNNVWGEATDDARAKDGIDGQYDAVEYLRYLKEMFGRESLDDKGMALLSNVHVYTSYANAFWDGQSMNYGDGDGGDNLSQTDTDTGGHECTHGVTQYSSNLVYRGESGALNEAGSDIIGACGFSWFLRGHDDAGTIRDYLLFEDSYTPKIPDDAIRYMNDPTRDGWSKDNYESRYTGSTDNGGVHWNSGIANNFFYLLANGGTNKTSGLEVERGIGMEKALRLYYRAHTVYFTPDTTFAQAREAWIKAASDIFGADSVEVKTAKLAATAVGIDGAPTRPPQLVV